LRAASPLRQTQSLPLQSPRISLIVPTLNERSILPLTLPALRLLDPIHELLFVDGGSTDGTTEWLEAEGITPIRGAAATRGGQLAEGAERATGNILWFLHADCIPSPEAACVILAAIQDGVQAGVCDVRFGGDGRASRFMTWLYPKLSRVGLYYGDSGIFVARELYEWAGGIRALPIFEDLDLVTRVRRCDPTGFARVGTTLQLSSRRFEGALFPIVFAQWTMLQALYSLGVHPKRLAKLYRPVR